MAPQEMRKVMCIQETPKAESSWEHELIQASEKGARQINPKGGNRF